MAHSLVVVGVFHFAETICVLFYIGERRGRVALRGCGSSNLSPRLNAVSSNPFLWAVLLRPLWEGLQTAVGFPIMTLSTVVKVKYA